MLPVAIPLPVLTHSVLTICPGGRPFFILHIRTWKHGEMEKVVQVSELAHMSEKPDSMVWAVKHSRKWLQRLAGPRSRRAV